MNAAVDDVPLASFALVNAGLAAGLALPHALAIAEVAPSSWEPARHRWDAAIEESAAGDLELLVRYDALFLSARDRFAPTLEPITSDARAWTHFHRHFLTSIEPPRFLAEHGLTPARFARLEAHWASRAQGDAAVATTLRESFEEPLEPCPRIEVTPSELLGHGLRVVAEPATAAPRAAAIAASQPASTPLRRSEPPPPPREPDDVRSLPTYLTAPGPEREPAPPRVASPPVAPPPPIVTAAAPPSPLKFGNPMKGTASFDLNQILRPALPFAGGVGAAGARPDAAPVPQRAPVSAFPGGPPPSSHAAPPPAPAPRAAPSSRAEPPAGAAGSTLPVLTLAQYASLCAELAHGGDVGAIYLRYGVKDAAARESLHRQWRSHLEDPATRARWQHLTEAYRARRG